MRESAMSRADRALLGDRLAEGDARLDAAAHGFQRALGQADQAHAVMDAAGAEPALRDLEAAAFAEQQIATPARARLSKVISPWPCGASS